MNTFIRPPGFQLDPNERTIDPTPDYPTEADTEDREPVEDEQFADPVPVVVVEPVPTHRVRCLATQYALDGSTAEPVMILANDENRVRAVITAATGTPTLLTDKTTPLAFGFLMVTGQSLELVTSDAVYVNADAVASVSVLTEYREV